MGELIILSCLITLFSFSAFFTQIGRTIIKKRRTIIKKKGKFMVWTGLIITVLSTVLSVVFLNINIYKEHRTALSEREIMLKDVELQTNFYEVPEGQYVLKMTNIKRVEAYIDIRIQLPGEAERPVLMRIPTRGVDPATGTINPYWQAEGAMPGDTLLIQDLQNLMTEEWIRIVRIRKLTQDVKWSTTQP